MSATPHVAVWSISAVAVLGVITRPRDWPEAWWVVAGAAALVLFALLPVSDALSAIGKGTDVYLFLTGMMLLAELARREGLFDWLASYALKHARGSASRLFLLIYAVGTVVTVFLSNDATAVVLTPAVYAAARQARTLALPYLLICALIANAASFVLPISNPANLVVYGIQLPTLFNWLLLFGASSAVAVLSTYFLLRWTQRASLNASIATISGIAPLKTGGRLAASAIGMTAVVLLVASTRGWQLGLPTCLCGVGVWLAISAINREAPWPVLRDISWSVLPLVAGLFVLVEGVEKTGVLDTLAGTLNAYASSSRTEAAVVGGLAVALCSNLINNLPMGLIASTLSHGTQLHSAVTGALLIGVDLGPNLSVTGSLATILWLTAIRREGENVSARRFLAVGCVVMPLSLLPTLGIFALTASRLSH